jgi:hypothetical protein
MAEAFGIAAGAVGVVSLSIQLAESLQKVKGFYAAVRNAPPQIEELIEEIEIMQDILSDLELASKSANPASGINLIRCMKVAQRATRSFAAFSSELQSRVKKSKYRGGVSFALGRDDIKQMLDHLERTKSSLNLAYNLYQQATSEERHIALIHAMLSSQGASVQKSQHVEAPSPTQSRSVSTDVFAPILNHKSTAGEQLFRIRTSRWISNTIWQLEAKRSIAGLSLSLRTYGVVSFHAPIFKSCREGNAVEMQRLFESRLASPFDENEYGHNLWEVGNIASPRTGPVINICRSPPLFRAMSASACSIVMMPRLSCKIGPDG